ncbi:uncharacterized protein [Littorina saxatilis]
MNILDDMVGSSLPFLMFLIPLCRSNAADRVPATYCHIECHVPGDMPSLTCGYPWDLNQTSLSFSVFRFKKERKEKVLGCNWSNGEAVCDAKSGFSPPKKVSNFFTMTIPKDEAEDYCCDIFPSETSTNVKRCRLNQKDTSTDRNDTATDEAVPSNNKSEGAKTADKYCQECSTTFSMTISCLMLTVIFLQMILIHCSFRRLDKQQQKMKRAIIEVQRGDTFACGSDSREREREKRFVLGLGECSMPMQ